MTCWDADGFRRPQPKVLEGGLIARARIFWAPSAATQHLLNVLAAVLVRCLEIQ